MLCVNSCPLFPVPYSLFPTSGRSLVNNLATQIKVANRQMRSLNQPEYD
ncbi:MAG: hypothetical protein F6K26_16550, partial [Moorea sp. SIO2I5]|nr:hypothetical protein [Moorena sp. SIO2I5]